jgi:hypothetical protein
MVEISAKIFALRERRLRFMRFAVLLALSVSAFAATARAQQAAQRATPSLTSEDLLDRRSAYTPASNTTRISSPARDASVGGLYRDPAGAFSLNLPSGSWQLKTRSQDKGKLSDLRVFRKLDADGFASATASVYVLSASASLSITAQVNTAEQRALAETLVARFLSNSASIVSAGTDRSGFQVVADQMVARRAVVRALISAFEQDGRLYVIICRAPLESFDAQAREFSAITQSLASSVARSS